MRARRRVWSTAVSVQGHGFGGGGACDVVRSVSDGDGNDGGVSNGTGDGCGDTDGSGGELGLSKLNIDDDP